MFMFCIVMFSESSMNLVLVNVALLPSMMMSFVSRIISFLSLILKCKYDIIYAILAQQKAC